MLGAIIGDIVGSRFEWHNIKDKNFELFTKDCFFTDDTVMTLAIAKAFSECENRDNLKDTIIKCMQEIGRKYPNCGYGGNFFRWIFGDDPKPYNSFGNGAAMRISSVAYVGKSEKEVKDLAKIVTEVSHNHSEGLKGAESIAMCIFLARSKKNKDEIREYVKKNYYNIDFTLDDIRDKYSFDVSCQGSVPEAIECFLEANSFEDSIRNAISIGGDSDTIAAITGSISEAYYGIPDSIKEKAIDFLDRRLKEILGGFEKKYNIEVTPKKFTI